VIKRIAPEVDVIDITHGIRPRQVLEGALVLARVLPYMPVGVHVGVVDPGVGTGRKALALGGRDGRFYVGPDNGLLARAADALGGVTDAVEIANRAYMLAPVSRTFHGRDVFSPVAAHLALGAALADLGPPVHVSDLVRLEIPEPDVAPFWLGTTVLTVDRFGNLQVNATGDDLAGAGIEPGTELEVEIEDTRHRAVAGLTFADAAPDGIVVYEDSYGRVALAVNGGDAAERLAASPGTRIGIACS
jgi:S-adenosylmethionine hydrolase